MILVSSFQLKIFYSNCLITLEKGPILPEPGNGAIPSAKAIKATWWVFFGGGRGVLQEVWFKTLRKHMQMIVPVGDARLSHAVRFLFCTVPKLLAPGLSTSLQDGSSMTILFYKQQPGCIPRNTPSLNAHMLPFEKLSFCLIKKSRVEILEPSLQRRSSTVQQRVGLLQPCMKSLSLWRASLAGHSNPSTA